MFVRRLVHEHILTTGYLNSNFMRMLPLALAQTSSGGVAIRYVLPVLWMTSSLPTNGQAKLRRHARKYRVNSLRIGVDMYMIRKRIAILQLQFQKVQ